VTLWTNSCLFDTDRRQHDCLRGCSAGVDGSIGMDSWTWRALSSGGNQGGSVRWVFAQYAGQILLKHQQPYLLPPQLRQRA